jgi:hypothetical protein
VGARHAFSAAKQSAGPTRRPGIELARGKWRNCWVACKLAIIAGFEKVEAVLGK